MYKKFGEFYKIDNGGVPKKPQNAKIAAPTPREIDTVKSPFSAAAYRELWKNTRPCRQKSIP